MTIVILGSFCGLKNIMQIHKWADNERVKKFLKDNYGVEEIPCYFWLTCLLKIIEPKSFNRCFIAWIQDFIGAQSWKNLTASFDGKTIRSTGKMDKYDRPLHIVSVQIAELGITLGQTTVNDKSNEIPAVRDLLELLKIEGCMVVMSFVLVLLTLNLPQKTEQLTNGTITSQVAVYRQKSYFTTFEWSGPLKLCTGF